MARASSSSSHRNRPRYRPQGWVLCTNEVELHSNAHPHTHFSYILDIGQRVRQQRYRTQLPVTLVQRAAAAQTHSKRKSKAGRCQLLAATHQAYQQGLSLPSATRPDRQTDSPAAPAPQAPPCVAGDEKWSKIEVFSVLIFPLKRAVLPCVHL